MSDPTTMVERTLVLPEFGSERSTALDDPRTRSTVGPALSSRPPWPVPAALATIVAMMAFVVLGAALGRDEGHDPAMRAVPAVAGRPADTLVVPPAAPNAVLAIGTADSFTSTILVDRGEDLLAALAINPSAVAGFEGSPVTGDAVVVQQVFGTDAFSVASSDGGVPVLVYVPGATDELQGFVAGSTEVLFSGTLHPTPSDLGDFLGYEPASVAARAGAYVVAAPETVVQVDPPTV